MNGIGILILLGIVMYFILSKNRGMGCCSRHSDHGSLNREPDHPKGSGTPLHRECEEIIDLKPGEYEVISEESRKS